MLTGKSIREMREMVGLKQIELAKRSGIDRSRLSIAENGHIQLREEELSAIQRVITSAAQQRAKQLGKLAEMEG